MADKTTIPCPECSSKGSITCPVCRGQGRQPSTNAAQRPCPNCHGSGKSICPQCRGARKVSSEWWIFRRFYKLDVAEDRASEVDSTLYPSSEKRMFSGLFRIHNDQLHLEIDIALCRCKVYSHKFEHAPVEEESHQSSTKEYGSWTSIKLFGVDEFVENTFYDVFSTRACLRGFFRNSKSRALRKTFRRRGAARSAILLAK